MERTIKELAKIVILFFATCVFTALFNVIISGLIAFVTWSWMPDIMRSEGILAFTVLIFILSGIFSIARLGEK
jgi:hypothetical protein